MFDQNEFSIDNFISEFKGGVKSFLFLWDPEIRKSDGSGLEVQTERQRRYLVKSSNFPSSSINEIIVEYQGLDFKMGGKRVYDDWNITLNVDVDGMIRYELEDWMNGIHRINKNEHQHFYRSNYTTTQRFLILKNNGSFNDPLLEIKLYHAWPKSIGPIALDYSSTEFAQFDLTFSYQYHIITKPNISLGSLINIQNFIEEIKNKISGLISG